MEIGEHGAERIGCARLFQKNPPRFSPRVAGTGEVHFCDARLEQAEHAFHFRKSHAADSAAQQPCVNEPPLQCEGECAQGGDLQLRGRSAKLRGCGKQGILGA